MRHSSIVMVALLAVGCGRGQLPPIPPPPPPPPTASSVEAPERALPTPEDEARARYPLSIQRILREQQAEIRDVLALTAPLPDPRGRARAASEASALANELVDIEASLAASDPETRSESYDDTVVKLQLLATRVAILHEVLRGAVSEKTAVQVDTTK